MNRKSTLAALAAVLTSGCAGVTEHLNRSLQDTYVVSEVCRVVQNVVELRPEEIKAELQGLGETLLGIKPCNVVDKDGTTQCTDSLRGQVLAFEADLQALIAKTRSREDRARYEKQVAELQASLQAVSDGLAALRGDIKAVLDDMKSIAGGRCASAANCYRDYRIFAARAINQTENRFHDLSTTVRRIGVQVQNLANDMSADGKEVQAEFEKAGNSLKTLTLGVQLRITNARKTIQTADWQDQLRSFGEKVGLMEAGRLTVRMVDKGVQSVDRVLDRVDEKAWFVASLSMAIYEADIRDQLKLHFSRHYGKGRSQNQELFRKLNAAFVLAACDQLAQPGDSSQGPASTPATGRGAYLLYPLFTAAVGALYETVHAKDAGGNIDLAQLDADKFQAELEKWLNDPGTKIAIGNEVSAVIADAGTLLKTTQSTQAARTAEAMTVLMSKHPVATDRVAKQADPIAIALPQSPRLSGSAPSIAAGLGSSGRAPASVFAAPKPASKPAAKPAPRAAQEAQVKVFTLTLPSPAEIDAAAKRVQ